METMPDPFSVEVHSDWSKVMEVRNDVLSALEQAKERGVENAMDAGVILPDPDGCWPPLPMNWPISLASADVRCPRKAQSRSRICGKSLVATEAASVMARFGSVKRACSSATEMPLRLVFEHGVVGRSADG